MHSNRSKSYKSRSRSTSPKGKRARKQPSQRVRTSTDYPWMVLQAASQDAREWLQPDDFRRIQTLVRSRDWDGVDQLGEEWNLQSMNSVLPPDAAIDQWQARVMLGGLIRKFANSGDTEARKQAGLSTFMKGEAQCSMYNRSYGSKVVLGSEILGHARWFIKKTIGGELPAFPVLTRTARHGPGSSTSTVKRAVAKYHKYSQLPYHVTSRCVLHASKLLSSDSRWMRALNKRYSEEHEMPGFFDWPTQEEVIGWSMTIVPGNRITTVPKGRKTDRPIAIEPTLNLMLQLGVDGFVRRRLKRWGFDLDDQSKNMALAWVGSNGGSEMDPVTIDLASASDTISMRICKVLLPEPWFRFLCDIRSPRGVLPDGTSLRYSKMSSMGNGSTFAIESLIFASIVYASCKVVLGYMPRSLTGVFGDDLIVPKVVSNTLIHNLELCGFSINRAKSFLEGPARESCGADWYRGRPVRGVYLKTPPTYVADLFCDRNRIHRWFKLRGKLTPSLDALIWKWIPRQFHNCLGPCSDEEFDCYWHTPIAPSGVDMNGMTQITKLYAFIREDKRPKDTWFQILQEELRPKPVLRPGYLPKRLPGETGSVFDVPGNRISRSTVKATIYNWWLTYSEWEPFTP